MKVKIVDFRIKDFKKICKEELIKDQVFEAVKYNEEKYNIQIGVNSYLINSWWIISVETGQLLGVNPILMDRNLKYNAF